MHQWLTQSCLQKAFSFHHISVRLSLGGAGGAGPEEEAAPDLLTPNSPEPKKKSVYVRTEFPETWLWTEEMIK